MYKFAKVVATPVYKILFRFRVTGVENIPATGGVILCSNHRSLHDTLVLGVASPRHLRFMAKYELWRSKLFGWLLTRLDGIPVNREKPSIETLKQTVAVLKEGGALAIFLQGGRRKDFDHDDAKAGVALFAIKGKVPIVPVNITSKFRLFSKIHVNIGAPISFEEYWGQKVRAAELNEIAVQVMDAIVALEPRTP
ncbi:MAG: 1-acyl-sn-glycerol-3-phosphate acyltransferase [Defluviitaleaceae bacterium]|nr:1-acyl-sn-glycerol-3-phosphate acyltransferase [Defluviitaleaceae bacterium]